MNSNKLNVGCGFDIRSKKEGWLNIDKFKECNPDLVVDIEKSLPFKDNSFEYLYSKHTLNHISRCKFNDVLKEMVRITKNEGIWEHTVPFDNIINRSSIDNQITFTWNSFSHLTKGHIRDYYHNFYIEDLSEKPLWITKAFFVVFPFFKREITFKFKILKKE